MATRSPNYPAIGLSEAVSLLEKLWRSNGASPMPIASAVEAMGFHGYSGPTRTKVSALRKYGLLDSVGQDIRVSELGKRVAKPISAEERAAALAEAARMPDLFRELNMAYPDASDSTLQAVLERQGFLADGARKAVTSYRDALTFANLSAEDYDGGESVDDDDAPIGQRRRGDGHGDRNERKPDMTVLSFQISDRLVEVAVPGGPLTKDEIGILRDYLTIQERVAPAQREPAQPSESASA